jgi:hypothetical protein
MKNTRLAMIVVVLIGSFAFSATELVHNTNAIGNIPTNSFDIHVFAPTTASPGDNIAIRMWTIFENATNGVSDLAFNHTSVGVANTTISFTVKTNLGPVPPHIHTAAGAFVTLAPFQEWVHPGAWSTNYTVPSSLGLYGVHVYANFTVIPARGAAVSYITQAETTFSVQSASATASDVSGLASASVEYGILGLVAVAVVLDLLLLFWKKSPVKP